MMKLSEFSREGDPQSLREVIDAVKDEIIDSVKSCIANIDDRSNANSDKMKNVQTWRMSVSDAVMGPISNYLLCSTDEQLDRAIKLGFLYPHDKSSKPLTYNCCILNIAGLLKNGYTFNNMPITQPHGITAAVGNMREITQIQSGGQFGGLTLPEVDTALEPYVEMSYNKYVKEYMDLGVEVETARETALKRVDKELEQSFQALECSVNTVSSFRGDYPFIVLTFGAGKSMFAKRVSMSILNQRMKGNGPIDKRIPAIFPKLVFLYDENIHGVGKECHDVFEKAVECSVNTQYPDFLSLNHGAVGELYQKWGKVISPMGCRAFLSPYWEKGGFEPAGDDDELSIYRFNMGVISLNIPMIIKEALVNGYDWKDRITYYQDLARQAHRDTVEFAKNLPIDTAPLAFRFGGFDGIPDWKNGVVGEDMVKRATISFGYGGLNEATMMVSGQTLVENKAVIAKEILDLLNKNIARYKAEDHILYALYGTPGESWLSTAVDKYNAMFGEDEYSKNGYWTNSFHVAVDTDIDPISKMKLEIENFHRSAGGHITYNRIQTTSNIAAGASLIEEAMRNGLYYGLNHSADYCLDCGKRFVGPDNPVDSICPKCGSKHILQIRRMNGYLGYRTGFDGRPRFHDSKIAEFARRKCM